MRFIRHLTSTGPAWATLTSDGATRAIAGDIFTDFQVTETPVTPTKILAPIEPTNIIGIGRNYPAHAAEGGKKVPERPMWFVKTSNVLQNPSDPIILPSSSTKVDYEGELAIVLGRDTLNATPANAIDHVLGYTIANDVSARDWQYEFGGGQYNHGKSFDTFCPLGPMLVTPAEIPNPDALTLVTRVNGEIRQNSTTAAMVFDVATLITFLSQDRTLPAGTVILTGTPSGVGFARQPPTWLQNGDTVEIEIENIGVLANPVVSKPLT
jgi:2-keto-4-pentenoate hydratase/2-oxohepta-3-ene-1,7-dioic acid hydratase in catechol pathway